MPRKLLRLSEIADRTGVPITTLRWLRHLDRGPSTFLLAGRVVAYEDDVDRWIEQERDDDPRRVDGPGRSGTRLRRQRHR